MPFGLKMSQDVFQMHMDQLTDRLPGIITIHNNICVYGKTQEQHDKHLLQLMKTAAKQGLAFNSKKCPSVNHRSPSMAPSFLHKV